MSGKEKKNLAIINVSEEEMLNVLFTICHSGDSMMLLKVITRIFAHYVPPGQCFRCQMHERTPFEELLESPAKSAIYPEIIGSVADSLSNQSSHLEFIQQ